MKIRLIHLAVAVAGVCAFNLKVHAQAQLFAPSTYKNIVIDGSFSDWAGVPLATNQVQVPNAKVQFQNLYVANDQNYLYIRFSLYDSTNPFTSSQNLFIDADTNYNTGNHEHGIGSDLLIQSGSGYQENSGVFNAGAVANLGWSSAPAVPANQFEVRISRNVLGTNGLPIFTNNTVSIYLESGEGGSIGNEWFPNLSGAAPGGLVYTFASPPSILTTNLPLVGLANTSWKFNASGTDLSTNWLGLTYDDSSWTSGLGLFGYTPSAGLYPPIQTALSAGPNTYYFRTHFTWNYQTANLAFVITNYLSDGAVYYINGVEVDRLRMPAGNVTYSTSANATNSPEGQPDILGIAGGALQIGDNVLEVETHQAPASSADMVFGLSLTAAAQYPPTIGDATLPADQTVTAGQSATFTANVFGSSLNYQWSFDGAPIIGATNSIFAIPLVLTNNAGYYALTVANSLGTNTTRSALLTVLSTPVIINSQPSSVSVVEGRPISLNVTASGSATLSYQWYQGADPVLGATNATYSIASANPTNAGNYYVNISNPDDSTNSILVNLTVFLDTIPPSVTNITAGGSKIVLTFSEPVDAASAGNMASYALSGGETVSSVTINSANQVTLTTGTPLTLGTVYSLSVQGVRDLFGNAANTSYPFAPTIIIDGNFDDWQGITPIYSGPSGSDGAADFKDIYIYDDTNYYYFRVTLWHDIPSASGQFPKYVDMFFDTDNNSDTGYSAIGSDFLQQSTAFYQEKNGNFNDGVTPLGINYLVAPTVPATSFPADFEFRYSKQATFGDGTPLFPTNIVNFLWEGQTPGFVVENVAPSDGGVISYTNNPPLLIPSLPIGQIAIQKSTAGKAALIWDASATLQDSSSLAGPWTNLPAATSPYVLPSLGNQQFFRLVH
jgi:hypothetical protein